MTEMNTVPEKQSVILLVDDNPINLQLLFETLDGQDYHLLVARSGEEALRIARKATPDLILLDIMMPGIDGAETAVIGDVVAGLGRYNSAAAARHDECIFADGYAESTGFLDDPGNRGCRATEGVHRGGFVDQFAVVGEADGSVLEIPGPGLQCSLNESIACHIAANEIYC